MIYINRIDENTLWVTSDGDAIGIEMSFKPNTDENEQYMIALAEFLGYDPASILALDTIDGGVTWRVK